MGPFDDLTAAQRGQIRQAHEQRKITAADLASRTDRGTCPVCGRDFQITKKGLVRTHGTQGAVPGRLANCTGSGQKPKEG